MEKVCITRLTSCDTSVAESISHLLGQLTSSPHLFGEDELRAIINDPASALFVLRSEGEVAGMLTVGGYFSPTGRKLWIEDVVVDARHRGKGYGRMLIKYAMEYARTLAPCTLMLTSNPARIAANELYRASGFEQKITNVYKINL